MKTIQDTFRRLTAGRSSDPLENQKDQFLNVFLVVSFGLLFILTIINLVIWIGGSFSEMYGFFLVQDVLFALILLEIWLLNHSRFHRLAKYAFFFVMVLGVGTLLSLADLNSNFILFAIPVLASGFILNAASPFLIAFLSSLVYSIAYLIEQPAFDFNIFAICYLFTLAFTTWVVARRLENYIKATLISEKKYTNLIENNPAFVYTIKRDIEDIWTFASPQIKNLLGYSPDEWMKMKNPWEKHIHPDDRTIALECDRESMRSGKPYQIEHRMYHRDGRIVWVNDLAIPLNMPDGSTQLQGVMLDITPRKRKEQIEQVILTISQAAFTTESLDDFYKLIHTSLDGLMPVKNFFIAIYDHEKDILSFPYFVDEYDEPPKPGKPAHGLTDYVLRTGKPLLALPDVFEMLLEQGEVESIGTPSIDWIGVPLRVKDRVIGVMVAQTYTSGTRYTEDDLRIFTFVSNHIAMVIERLQAEKEIRVALEEKEVLLREIHHRVKNNLQVISSLLNLQMDFIVDANDRRMFEETQARVKSIAYVHEELYQSRNLARVNFADYVERVTTNLFDLFQLNPNIKLSIEVEDIELGVDTAIPCGLIINELVSNSLKYAFPNNQKGEILIRLAADTSEAEKPAYVLTVADNGIGIPEDILFPHQDSLGLQLVNILSRQLGGHIQLSREKGTTFSIRFPQRPMN